MNSLFSGFFREGPNLTPSMTRLVLLLCALTACAPLLGWTWTFVRFAWAPDLPGNVILAQGGLLTLAAALKGWERQAVEATRQQEIKTAGGTETVSMSETRSGKESARSTAIESSGPTPK